MSFLFNTALKRTNQTKFASPKRTQLLNGEFRSAAFTFTLFFNASRSFKIFMFTTQNVKDDNAHFEYFFIVDSLIV